MKRRAFIHTIGAAGAAAAGGFLPPLPRRSADQLQRIGLELYSVRHAMARDPERTLAAVRAIGYTDVELLWSFGNFGRTTEQVRAALDKEGLRAPSAHCSPTILLVGWERSLAIAQGSVTNTSSCRASRRTRPARSTIGGNGPTASTPPVRRRGAPASGSPSTTKPIT